MAIHEIWDKDSLLARHITSDEWSSGLRFFSSDQDYVQVGTWRYDGGKKLLPHIHNEAVREARVTQEVLYIRTGSIAADIYNAHQQIVTTLTAKAGDLLVLLAGGHGYSIIEDDTQVLEVKNGPYFGAERDRRRF